MKKFRNLRQEVAKYDYGTPESVKLMKKMTPGEKSESTAKLRIGRALKKQGVGKHDDYYLSKMDPETRKKYEPAKRPPPAKINKPTGSFKWFATRDMKEGSESWEAGYKRRVVKTTDPDHKKKGYNWRIKGKDRPEISIKLYKEKPSQAEFNKQMRRVAGHEFGG